ncbi:MAG TPA: AI-2E family transporter [candidate division Zixibacteria bacterium]|nr:AI-2E family transporter [candidate division Zixibacteria bacterium]
MNEQNKSSSATLIDIAMPFIAVILGLAFCYFAAPVIVPVIIGISLAYVFYPAVKFLKKLKIPHLAALFIVTIITLVLFAGMSLVIYYQGMEFIKTIPTLKAELESFLIENFSKFRETVNNIFPDLIPQGEGRRLVENTLQNLDYQRVGEIVFRGLGSVFAFFGNVILISIIAFFLIMEADVFKRNLTLAFGEENQVITGQIMTEINRQISSYFALKFIITVGLAIVYTAGLLLMRIDYAYIWGPLAAVITLIPIIGAYAGGIPPMIVAVIQYDSAIWFLWVSLFFLVVQFIESYIISPKVFGDQANLNLTTVIVSTILWGWMWGIIGIILAVPMTAAIKVICSHIEPLHPIARILEGRIKF